MVGLPIDDDGGSSTANLVARAAEAQLRSKVVSLREQLQAAEAALERLRTGLENHHSDESEPDHNEEDSMNRSDPKWNASLPQNSVQAAHPVSKQGYLFKWLDRTIGWSGTKWALRFVNLDGNRGQISYFGSHLDAQPRYVLSLRDCAVRDDGWKRNQRHKRKTEESDPPLEEPGAYFFLLSIYQRPGIGSKTNEQDIVPLLRFSTPSLAEKMQWIQLIAEACAYCETEQWLAEEAERAAELDKQQRQQSLMTSAMPESKEGTLPPLFFAPHKQHAKHKRRPSFSRTPSSAAFRTKSKNADAEQADAKSRLGYPPSKPMHRASAPSYLSVEAPVQNYRGFFNLGVLILIVSNVRLLVSSVRKHGFVVTAFVDHLKDLSHIRQDPWEEFPFISGFLLQLVFITNCFCIEWLLSRKRVYTGLGMFLHHLNAHTSLAVPVWIVWNFIDEPPVGAVLLLHATITWMKLLSYVLANEDYRLNEQDTESLLALVEDLDPEDADLRYPSNVTARNMIYFWFCPSLTYQIAFPKTPHRRWWKIGGIIMRLVICVSLFTFVAAQVVSPVLAGLVQDLEATGGSYTVGMMADYWLKLAIANTYLWLLLFYGYFHLYMNLFGEILRFGDRVFYRDWWNVLDVGAYWRYVRSVSPLHCAICDPLTLWLLSCV
jgi:diacylglycerol O-acyltransferase 1